MAHSFEQLEALWSEASKPARRWALVELLVARIGDGAHRELASAEITVERGLEGDRWLQKAALQPLQQLTVMNVNVARLVCDGQPLHMPGDNVLVDLDLSEAAAPVGCRLRVGSALVEVTEKPHLGCKKFTQRFGDDAMRWVNHEPWRDRRLRGVNCRVLESGVVRLGDRVDNLGGPNPSG